MEIGGLQIDSSLVSFEAIPETEIDPGPFWSGLAALLSDLAPRNRELRSKATPRVRSFVENQR
jgi:malate synthase